MLKKGTIHILFTEFLSKGTNFLSVLIVASFFSKEVFGLLSIYYVVFEFFTILISNGINALARINYFKQDADVFSENNLAHLVNSFLTTVFVIFLSFIFFPNNQIELFFLALASFFRTILMLSIAIVQCKELSKTYMKLNLLNAIIYNFLFILFLYFDYNVEAWIYSIFISNFFTSLISLKYQSYKSLKTLTSFSFVILFRQLKNGLIFLPQAIGFWFRSGSERFYVSTFLSLSILGIYSFNFQISLPVVIFGTAINIYLTPIVAKLVINKDFNTVLIILKKYVYLTVIAAFFFVIIALIISKTFFYDKYFNSFYLTFFLTLINLIYVLSLMFLNPLYYMEKKQQISLIILCYGLSLTIINFFAIKYFKLEGLIFSNILINLTLLFISYHTLNKNINRLKAIDANKEFNSYKINTN